MLVDIVYYKTKSLMLVISIQSVFSFKSRELDCQARAFDYSLIHNTLNPYCMAPYAHRVPSGSFELGLAGPRGEGLTTSRSPTSVPSRSDSLLGLGCLGAFFFLLHACLFLLESLDEVFQVYPTEKRTPGHTQGHTRGIMSLSWLRNVFVFPYQNWGSGWGGLEISP